MADTTDFGVLRMIVDQPEQAKQALRSAGVVVKSSEVLAFEVEDKPGALAELLRKLSDGGVGIEYMYASIVRRQDKAMMIFRVDDADKAETLLA